MLLDGLHNGTEYTRAMAPVAAVTNNTAFVSGILDTNGFLQNEFVLITGANTDADATFTILVEDGAASNLSDNAAVADEFLLGTESPGFLFSDDNSTFKIGYIGPKRYIRVTITPVNNTGDVYLAALWAQSGARKGPYSTQVN